MTAESIANALAGRKAGRGWMARCPAHNDATPSLSIQGADDGRVLVHCFAGCGQTRVIAMLRSRGLWIVASPYHCFRPAPVDVERGQNEPELGRIYAALAIWRAGAPAKGTPPVETYLASRGIDLRLPESLRLHHRLKHPSDGNWPAMVVLVTSGVDGRPVGIHRTFLALDGIGKAPVDPSKMMFGPCRGGVVRLADIGPVLMVGEGIETSLTAMMVTGHSAWAALSTSGLRTLDLPKEVRDVVVLADGDEAGEAAAQNCGWRWKRQGRRALIARPPQGMDFNDMLMRRTPSVVEGA
jgi:hypothetical protein